MQKQDKATTERNARTLRELVKQPGNKSCADCKRSDPRWASWNLGIFLCIRCSGIHRSMGTHISRVKSIDLDVWTPEQLDSMVRWGNINANLYWEAHLKPGHVPPDHKVESFIRSKYESRRWAPDTPLPDDPSVLRPATDSNSSSNVAPIATGIAGIPPSSLGLTPPIQGSGAVVPKVAPSAMKGGSQQPFEDNVDLFALDFTQPSAPQSPANHATKSDIMSLFSSGQQVNPAPQTSLSPHRGTNLWNAGMAQSSGVAEVGSNIWSNQKQKDDLFGDIWSDLR